MSVELEIRDGDPWWLSPDIWVVPGLDPLGPPGLPVAGMNAFLWARVRNNGDTPAINAEIRFYWADPSSAFDRNSAHYVGSSFASVAPGAEMEVLCLAPWVPEFVNNGHECVLAEAFHNPLDTLPSSPAFNVPTDRRVAQRNLTVGQAMANGFFMANLFQHNTSRLTAEFQLVAEQVPLTKLKPLLPALGFEFDLHAKPGALKAIGFSEETCPGPEAVKAKPRPKIDLAIPAHGKTFRTLIGTLEGGPALIHVKQYHGKRLIGGQSVLVLPPAEASAKKTKKQTARRAAA